MFACWIKQLISTILVHLIANHSVENITRLRTYTLATTWFTLATTWRRKWASFASSRKETQYYRTSKNGSVSKSVCLQIKVNSFELLLLSLSIIEACNNVFILDIAWVKIIQQRLFHQSVFVWYWGWYNVSRKLTLSPPSFLFLSISCSIFQLPKIWENKES